MKTRVRHRQRAKRWVRRPGRPRAVPWGIVATTLLIGIGIPTFLASLIAYFRPGFIVGLHYGVSIIYTVTSVMIIWESCAAWRAARAPAASPDDAPLPRCTAIVAAYLPNEQGIILETLQHMLARLDVPEDRLEVILAYNTPEPLAVENALQQMARRDRRLRLLRVAGSRSKAENVNAALDEAAGEIVAIYDADHQPEAACFRKAWRWLSSGYDMVQGRCVIRNGVENWLTHTVDVEFDCIYAVSHQGRFGMSGTAIFGGSNGYWRRDALAALRLNPAMLTEDIDSSVRALLAGQRLVHDRDIVSEELAPDQFRDWMFQRKRWAQGWLEVTLKHLRALMRTPHLTAWQKGLWFYLLAWRECYPLLSLQFFTLVFTGWLVHRPVAWFGSPFFLTVGVLNLGCSSFQVWVSYRRAARIACQQNRRWYLVYAVVGLVYTTVKTIVTLVAQYSHLLHDREWITTPRSARAASIGASPPSSPPPRGPARGSQHRCS